MFCAGAALGILWYATSAAGDAGPVLAASGSSSDSGGRSLADRLFERALPFANKSLNGRFISQMADGTLPEEVFRRYLFQDNLYLTKYSRAFAVLAARSEVTDEFVWLVNMSGNYLHEHGRHAGPGAGASSAEFDRYASPVTTAYTSLLLQAAWAETSVLGFAAVLPCQRLYDWLFAELKATRPIADSNPYKAFIDQYADPSNHAATTALETFLERHAARGLPADLEEQAHMNYNTAMRYEAEFFDQGFAAQSYGQVASSNGESIGTSVPLAELLRSTPRRPWSSSGSRSSLRAEQAALSKPAPQQPELWVA